MAANLFDGNDLLYQAWLQSNPQGFVINARRRLTPSYMVLHRASCSSIRRYRAAASDGAFTERDYIKVCDLKIESLRGWVREHGRSDGSFSNECGMCKPV